MSPQHPTRGIVRGPALSLLAALAFATSGIFASSLLTIGWTPGSAVLVRIGISALVLLVPGLLSLAGRWRLMVQHSRMVIIYGVFAVGMAQLSFFSAVQYLSVGVALLIEYLSPVLVVLWLWVRHGHTPRRLTVVGVAIAMTGLLLVLDLTGARVHPIGVMWSLAAAIGASVYFVIAGSIPDEFPTVALTSGGMTVAAGLLVAAAVLGIMPLAAPRADVTLGGQEFSWVVAALGVVLVSSVTAYLAGAAGARLLGSKVSAVFGLLEVLAAVGYAWLLLGQAMRPLQLVGGSAIIAGLLLVHVDERTVATSPEPGASQADDVRDQSATTPSQPLVVPEGHRPP